MTTDSAQQVQLRQDLQQSRQQQQGKSYLVVKDPLARRYFRFTESQAAILELMSAPTTPETIAARIKEKLGATVPASTIAAFCDSLKSRDLLETPEVRERLGSGRKRNESSVLYRQVASFNPEKLFDWLLPRTRWAFTPWFHIIGCFLIACGLTIAYINWPQLKTQAPNLFSFWTILMIWPIAFAVSFYHEFSHGLTCRHFGGQVKEVGFMLIYFSPAFYCDVSDAWMFPSRRQRMLVTLAGSYSQLILWGLCTIIWRLTETDTAINHIMVVVVLFCGLQTLFNLNPLIKLDGYYMLSDYLEVPNLRDRASKTLWKWMIRDPKRGSFHQQRSLLLYAVCATVFSTTLLVGAYSALYTWSTGNWATAGLVGFAVFSTLTLRRTAVESMSGLKTVFSYVSAKKIRNTAILLIALFLSYVIRMELKVTADFKILPQSEITVKAETPGVLVDIIAREGVHVKKGDLLARTRDFDKQTELQKVSGELEQTRNILERLKAGARPEEIREQESRIAAKKIEIDNARRNQEQRNRVKEVLEQKNIQLANLKELAAAAKKMFEQDIYPKIRMDEAQSLVDVKQREITETEAQIRIIEETADRETDLRTRELTVLESGLALLKAGNRKETIQETEATIAKLEGLIKSLTQEIGKSEIRAPMDGVVATPFPERKLNQRLAAGEEFIRLVNASGVIAEMLVPEKELAYVKPGNVTWLKARSLPTEDFEGRVDFIANVAQNVAGQHMVVVRTQQFPNENDQLKPDMTGVARIYCGQRRVIDIATLRFRTWVRTEFLHLLP